MTTGTGCALAKQVGQIRYGAHPGKDVAYIRLFVSFLSNRLVFYRDEDLGEHCRQHSLY